MCNAALDLNDVQLVNLALILHENLNNDWCIWNIFKDPNALFKLKSYRPEVNEEKKEESKDNKDNKK